MISLKQLISDLGNLELNWPVIFAIDGVAGSGKTTLANNLESAFSTSQIVHMDDLYNGWDNPLSVETTNRVIEQIVIPFLNHKKTRFQKFNWSINKFDHEIALRPSKILFLEGVGSGQTAFRKFLSKIIWVEFDANKGFERVIARDGQEVSNNMINFLIVQNKHFIAELTKNAADYTISGVP